MVRFFTICEKLRDFHNKNFASIMKISQVFTYHETSNPNPFMMRKATCSSSFLKSIIEKKGISIVYFSALMRNLMVPIRPT